MGALLPNCDRCGRFTAHAVEIYDAYQPDPWNGPRTTLLCERCAEQTEGDRG